MPAEAPQSAYLIEAYDPARHDRSTFSCGVSSIDNFLKLTAKKQQSADFVRVRVAMAEGGNRVIGFYALNAHAIDVGELPASFHRVAPRHGLVPAAFISMIGVDRTIQGRSVGKVLLADAFKQILKAAETVATAVVVLDILDDGDAVAFARRERYYRSHGFVPLGQTGMRMYIALDTVRQATKL